MRRKHSNLHKITECDHVSRWQDEVTVAEKQELAFCAFHISRKQTQANTVGNGHKSLLVFLDINFLDVMALR